MAERRDLRRVGISGGQAPTASKDKIRKLVRESNVPFWLSVAPPEYLGKDNELKAFKEGYKRCMAETLRVLREQDKKAIGREGRCPSAWLYQ